MLAAIAPFAILLLCAVPWLLVIGRRVGHMLAAVSVLTGLPLLVLLSFHISRVIGSDPVLLTLGMAVACGLLGVALVIRLGSGAPSRAAVLTWVPSTAGLLAWLATLAVAPLIGGSVRGWAMNGDAGNNVRITREMLANSGHLLESLHSVPLQNELLAIATWAGRGGSSGDLLSHDLYALAVFGALAIGLTGVLIGATVTSLLPVDRHGTKVAAAALASLAATTWFVSGLPIESGYLNVHVALPFALASWLAFLGTRQYPRVGLALLLGLCLVLLSSWAPLVVIPLGLGIATVLRFRDSPRVPRGRIPLAIVAGAVMLGVAVVAPQLPKLRQLSLLLADPGHGYPSTMPVLGATIVGCLVGAWQLRRWLGVELRGELTALTVSVLVGLAVLLAINVGSSPPWLAYYPAKYTWLVTVVLATVLLSVAVRACAALGSGRSLAASAAVVLGALAIATVGPAPLRENFTVQQPLARIATDAVWTEGEDSVDAILDYAENPGIELQWATGSPDEGFINFWALEFKGGGPRAGNGTARYYSTTAYRTLRDTGSFTTPLPQTLCAVVESLGGHAIVHTRDTSLDALLTETCPEVSFDVRLDLPPLD